ncbi:hypothetical protein CcI156_17810 [Frankia sp. CcI156]|uniref:hypothetical protein n=1 Tax=unclassified Frankia TaxID=2632575 RepID=UPI0003CFBAE5|nr:MULTISPECIES: hypothetical protein [unclassified Frankia]KFB04696.1 hypothetical protein ALLO2DRAFT_02626 [Frankia sp. Allo2]ETA01250.1 hypothetical protein CcI6DRAFT_03373 [Frankia sp. CcI6]KDA44261.1 hypothetical protein BMG523Draft_00757 [Frankia sp. BMG5.23]OFB42206.1 hypothetical protein Manayef4_15230 [Frankia sp. CgIM4]ONH23770.1 hypothetical protein CcI156_17810 [Frankia sp. CcI156]
MTLKARLRGRETDLALLSRVLPTGDTQVSCDEEGYYLTSTAVDHRPEDTDFYEAAAEVLAWVNGIGWLNGTDFHAVELTGMYDDGDRRHAVLTPETIRCTTQFGKVVVGGDAVASEPPPPPGPPQAAAAARGPALAEALAMLGRATHLGWVELYKVWEIVQDGRDPIALGWVTKAEKQAFKQAANHPGISGQAARHARMPGTPSKTSAMSLTEGRALIRRVILAWIAAESI